MDQDKCMCEKSEPSQDSDSSTSDSPSMKEKRNKIGLTLLGLNLKRGRSLQFKLKRNKTKSSSPSEPTASTSSPPESLKKSPKWGLKFCVKKETKSEPSLETSCCKCECYKKNEDVVDIGNDEEVARVESKMENLEVDEACGVQQEERLEEGDKCVYGTSNGPAAVLIRGPVFETHMWMMHEDCDETARRQRAKEIEQGVDPPANFKAIRHLQLLCSDIETENGLGPRRLQLVCPSDLSVDSLRALFQKNVTVRTCPLDAITGCHTQVDFIHCLVPDLLDITNCSFYWGKMDRYEAERLLDGKPEGTFLLRDSAQEEFLFSVSFRKYGRSLHARIEQWNHKFSFDSHDPGVYTSNTVCGLIEHYKDPSSCMFFEPMLTWPLHRNFTFSLQHLSRATITNRLTYDNVNQLQLPKTLKSYLKEYHYRQKVRVERFDDDVQWLDLRSDWP